MFLYWTDTATFNETAHIFSAQGGMFDLATTLNSSDVSIGMGFSPTINGPANHRIFEMAIDVNSLDSFNASAFHALDQIFEAAFYECRS